MDTMQQTAIRRPHPVKITSPPFCWVIFSRKGDKFGIHEEGLLIFLNAQDAQGFIDKWHLVGWTHKSFFWGDLVKKFKGQVQEIILDLRDGSYVSFPVEL